MPRLAERRIATAALLVLAACVREEPPARDQAAPPVSLDALPVPVDCASPATDSARAVCAAIRHVSSQEPHPRVYDVYREGGAYCVTMGPSDPRTVDGGIGVRVGAGGEVLGVVYTDSAYCPPAGAGLAGRR